MAWPVDEVATGDLITAAQLNRIEVLLASTLVSGSVAPSIDFQSIPAHWTHLRVEIEGRTDVAAETSSVLVRLNNDSAGNYNQQRLSVLNTTVSASPGDGTTGMIVAVIPGGNGAAGAAGGASFVIASYADTTFHKSLRGFASGSSLDGVGSQRIDVLGGRWRNTAAVNRVTLLPGDGSNFAVGTRASIYGMGTI